MGEGTILMLSPPVPRHFTRHHRALHAPTNNMKYTQSAPNDRLAHSIHSTHRHTRCETRSQWRACFSVPQTTLNDGVATPWYTMAITSTTRHPRNTHFGHSPTCTHNARTHRNHVDKGCLPGVLKTNECELHFLLPKQRLDPLKEPCEERHDGACLPCKRPCQRPPSHTHTPSQCSSLPTQPQRKNRTEF